MIKFEALVAKLKNELRNGKYPVGSRFPSVYDIARECDVNKTTANKAVVALMTEGYLERAATSRAGTVVKTMMPFPSGKIAYIGIIRHPFFATIASGTFDSAMKKNYIIVPQTPKIDQLDLCLKRLEDSGFQGIVSCGYGMLTTKLPVVYLEVDRPEFPGWNVGCDNYRGGYDIVRRIVNSGRKNICFFAGSNGLDKTARISGMCTAALEYGIHDAEKRFFLRSGESLNAAVRTLKAMMEKFPGFSAVVTDSDDRVLELMRAGRELGIDIPGKILATGFGNVHPIQMIASFPTVDEHPYEIGFCAVEKLIDLIENGPEGIPRQTLLDIEILNTAMI